MAMRRPTSSSRPAYLGWLMIATFVMACTALVSVGFAGRLLESLAGAWGKLGLIFLIGWIAYDAVRGLQRNTEIVRRDAMTALRDERNERREEIAQLRALIKSLESKLHT